MNTSWKKIKSFNNYSISSIGEVRNDLTGRILKSCDDGNGYRLIRLCENGIVTRLKIHRIVAEHFLKKPRKDLIEWAKTTKHGKVHVNHIDGNKSNNNYTNLEWCTVKENTKHAYDKNLIEQPSKKGIKNNNSKLSEEEVRLIRKEYCYGSRTHGSTALSKKYNVSKNTILYVVSLNGWKSLK